MTHLTLTIRVYKVQIGSFINVNSGISQDCHSETEHLESL